MMPREDLAYLSSRLLKEVCSLGGDIRGLVPEPVLARLRGGSAVPAPAPPPGRGGEGREPRGLRAARCRRWSCTSTSRGRSARRPCSTSPPATTSRCPPPTRRGCASGSGSATSSTSSRSTSPARAACATPRTSTCWPPTSSPSRRARTSSTARSTSPSPPTSPTAPTATRCWTPSTRRCATASGASACACGLIPDIVRNVGPEAADLTLEWALAGLTGRGGGARPLGERGAVRQRALRRALPRRRAGRPPPRRPRRRARRPGVDPLRPRRLPAPSASATACAPSRTRPWSRSWRGWASRSRSVPPPTSAWASSPPSPSTPSTALRRAGVRVSVNSDDPPLFDTTLTDEYLAPPPGLRLRPPPSWPASASPPSATPSSTPARREAWEDEIPPPVRRAGRELLGAPVEPVLAPGRAGDRPAGESPRARPRPLARAGSGPARAAPPRPRPRAGAGSSTSYTEPRTSPWCGMNGSSRCRRQRLAHGLIEVGQGLQREPRPDAGDRGSVLQLVVAQGRACRSAVWWMRAMARSPAGAGDGQRAHARR